MTSLFQLAVRAGRHDRRYCPVDYRLPADSPLLRGAGKERIRLAGPNETPVPLQCEELDGELKLCWIVDRLAAGEEAVYTVLAANGEEADSPDVVRLSGSFDGNGIDVYVAGEYFTTYVHDPGLAKPYLGPLIGPGGERFTRLDFDTKEHPHHRSVWLAIGDVNGIDLWNEPTERHGRQLAAGAAEQLSGPVYGRIEASLRWCSFGGKAQLAERRTITVYATPAGERLVDMECELTALGRVELGATKEAGPLGIRVAETMNADNGGTIRNAFGSVGEQECWGQRAPWCDYYGRVGARTLGIAAFDHPDNLDYPTFWHVRDYGLLAANNLYFAGGKLLAKGQTIRYRHRLYLHEGDTVSARVADKFHDYIHPPEVALARPESG